MNTIHFNQTGGFRLSTNILDALQSGLALLGGLGEMAGDKTILQGCEQVGANITDGIVYLNGEAFVFKGGAPLASVKIYEAATQKIFENGVLKDVVIERWVGFGSGTGAIPWSDFVRIDTLKNLKSRILPPNTNPQLYSGSVASIPTGWQLCDGTNGTPDLRGRFIVGYHSTDTDYNAIGKTGGEKTHTLTVNEMPNHNHGGFTNHAGSHTHTMTFKTGSSSGGGGTDLQPGTTVNETKTTSSSGNHNHTISGEGGGAAHENRPPYYTLAYIIYTGN
ncbi:phage baseplate protein [Formosa sp. A9]|uniref:phage baseplate protein n=1 Tax=Formosa sp. A9 TaxID=3442641 RepID=UPI003EBD591C